MHVVCLHDFQLITKKIRCLRKFRKGKQSFILPVRKKTPNFHMKVTELLNCNGKKISVLPLKIGMEKALGNVLQGTILCQCATGHLGGLDLWLQKCWDTMNKNKPVISWVFLSPHWYQPTIQKKLNKIPLMHYGNSQNHSLAVFPNLLFHMK